MYVVVILDNYFLFIQSNMDDWQLTPSSSTIVIIIVVVLVIVGLIILLVAIWNSNQSTSSNSSSSGSNSNQNNQGDPQDQDDDNDDAFDGGAARPVPPHAGKPPAKPAGKYSSIEEAARDAELATVEDFHGARNSCKDVHAPVSSDIKRYHNFDDTPKISGSIKANSSVGLELSLHMESSSKHSGDINLLFPHDSVPKISDIPQAAASSDSIPKVSVITKSLPPSDTLPDVSELSPSELEVAETFNDTKPSQILTEIIENISQPLIDSMNKSQNEEELAHKTEIIDLSELAKEPQLEPGNATELAVDSLYVPAVSAADETLGQSFDASVTNPASLSSDFSNPTEKSERKDKKGAKYNSNLTAGLASLTKSGLRPRGRGK